jgi:hypothetical protein
MNGATHAEARHNMIAPIESDDPDFLVHSAWLAEASKGADGPLVKQVLKQGDGRPNDSTSSLYPADQLVTQDDPLAPRDERKSGLIKVIVPGCIFAIALAAGIAIRPHFPFFESWRHPTVARTPGPDSSEPLTSATPAKRHEAQTPKLIVEPSLGVAGEPAPIKLALQGWGDSDVIIIIRGLEPGMELSTGAAVAADTWQLSARDLPHVWIAPPQGFVGSADLVAELRLPNAQIADRQTLHVEWTRPAAAPGHEPEPTQITPQQENEMMSPTSPPIVRQPNDRDLITTTPPPISVERSQGDTESYGKSARTRGGDNVRRYGNEGNRRTPLATDGTNGKPAVKGFWDWSR